MNSQATIPGFLDPPKQDGELGRLGPYRVLSSLGQGGMGQVFLAEDMRLKRPVALKVMSERIAATPHSRKRFIEEARSMAAVHHENVVTIFEVGERNATPFMAMELLEGETLDALIASGRRLREREIYEIAIQIASGLAAAHARGIIHRDIKPANIWIEPKSGRVKILDFGLAIAGDGVDHLSGRHRVMGSPGYLSPEQARSDVLDDRTDLYSLGVVLFQLCTGELPLSSGSVPGQLVAIITRLPKSIQSLNPSISQPLANIIDRLLAKEPVDRPRSAVELERQLRELAEDDSSSSPSIQIVTAPTVPVSSTPTKPEPTKRKPPSRLPLILSGIGAVLVVALASFTFLTPKRKAAEAMKIESAPPKEKKRAVPVTVDSLKPLQLTAILAADSNVVTGQPARYKLSLDNSAGSASVDPRRLHGDARVAAQVMTYLRGSDAKKRPAPVFPKKLTPTQLPMPGMTQNVDIQFIAQNIPMGKFEVIFELQTPTGDTINSLSTSTTIEENLREGELIGFESLRTSIGNGEDVSVKRGDTAADAAAKSLAVQLPTGAKDAAVEEHLYLRFDISKAKFARSDLDRAVVMLTVAPDSLEGKSELHLYGIPEANPDLMPAAWKTSGDAKLSWDSIPSREHLNDLIFLGSSELDNSGGRLKDKIDEVRLFGPNLDDFIRQSNSTTLAFVIVRHNTATKATRFHSKESSPENAPSLSLRRKP